MYTVETVRQFVSGESICSDWHTIGYLLFVKLCYKIYPSIYVVNIVQCIMWQVINWCALSLLDRDCEGQKPMVLYTMIAIMFFTPYYYLQIMYKDVVFSMCLFATTLFLIYYIKTENIKKYIGVLGFLAMSGVAVFRHAGLVPVVITLLCLIINYARKNKRKCFMALGYMVLIILTYHGVLTVGDKVLHAEKKPEYITYSNPIYMISVASHENITFEQEDIDVLEKIMPIAEWGEYYNKYWVDDVSRDWGKIGSEHMKKIEEEIQNNHFGRKLILINGKLFLRHPVFYITHLMDPSSIIWEIATPNDGYDMACVGAEENEDIIYNNVYKMTHGYGIWLHSMPIIKDICFRGGFFLFIIICVIVLWGLEGNIELVFSLFPVLIVDILLLITTPAQDPRYVLGTMEIGCFLLAYMVGVKKCNSERRASMFLKSGKI